ncbi:DnaD domain protein [Bacillus sp. 31A1R]|uniref:DnaD domain protein n=1 Tax=Robertmurraya mangrovi TaxID=3098077 RepID=A0ABU5J1M8_9BACI|nr:DnaD domain protein [Bacillus sp. 31A1R]MDZ5473266.1 DnaD domain protein [Bacillus sp. 31A1R]
MAKFRLVRTDFWKNPIVTEEMTPEDRYFYLYLLTNPHTTQIGIYKVTKKQMAFDLGYPLETVHLLMERFISHHKLIRYNPATRELAIQNWGKYNLNKGGKPVMDCITSELKDVEDTSLIEYVLESILKQDIRNLYESFCIQEYSTFNFEQEESETTIDLECEEPEEMSVHPYTVRGQKEKEYEKEKEKQQQQKKETFRPETEINTNTYNDTQLERKQSDVKEIVEFWDHNGFGLSNVNAKEQLLYWLEDSDFLQPKDVILKAMKIACANSKRRLNYVVGILKNWDNEQLLTVEEIDLYLENQQYVTKPGPLNAGRDIPTEFELDLTAGED